MTPEQMKEKFESLYNYMASSNNVAYMHTFGNVHKEMMAWMILNKPDMAQEWIEKLCSIKWRNYLTQKEAEKIVVAMNPKAPWTREVWKQTMESLDIPIEEEPYYNSCALWVVMNMIYSDSSKSIANIIGKPLQDIPSEQLVNAIHSLAIDKLKDIDGKFDVRKYFNV